MPDRTYKQIVSEQKKITNALETIKGVCAKYENCEICPLHSIESKNCYVMENAPEKWEIDPLPTYWHAFK